MQNRQEVVILPKSYMIPEPNNPLQQLEFAIKHEGINLEIIATFYHIFLKRKSGTLLTLHRQENIAELSGFYTNLLLIPP